MPYHFSDKKHVFSDWDLIEPGSGLARYNPAAEREKSAEPRLYPVQEMPYGVRISTHYPRLDRGRLVEPDMPCEGLFICYATVFEDDGLYRMYSMNFGEDLEMEGDGSHEIVTEATGGQYFLAYAESVDGVNWKKPEIGAVRCNGSTANNLVYAGHASPVFKDPGAPPQERYKLLTMGIDEHRRTAMYGAVSADGFHFTTLEKPVLSGYGSDTHNVVRFDPDKGRYVGYFRGKVHGNRNLRTIAYAETDCFDSWPMPEVIVTPDVNDCPDTDIYTNSYIPWPDADAHLMFPAFYQRRLDDTEIHVLTSRDGQRWERPLRQPIIPAGDPARGFDSSVYAGSDLISMRPGECSLPIAPRPCTHNQYEFPGQYEALPHRGYVCLATWRQDGFTSLEAETEGFCATVPFTFEGGRLQVNAWTQFGGGIRVELADTSVQTKCARTEWEPGQGSGSQTIPGYSFADSDPISGDSLNHMVTWNGESDLSAWAGKSIRLRFHLRRARLHAIRFN